MTYAAMNELYDTDIVLWSESQAALLRRIAAGDRVNDATPDWANIIEEIESVGSSERAALASHIGTIIEHLMKLEASPAAAPRPGWRETVIRSRALAAERLEDSPSLRGRVEAMLARQLVRQRAVVAEILTLYGETPVRSLDAISYTEEQVLGPWWPQE